MHWPERRHAGSESQFSTDDGEAPQLPPFPQNQDIHSRVVLVKNEPSSDTPVIVSERCLRKRKRDGEPEQATGAQAKVKIENSSNPLMIGEQHRFTAHESIDFDVGGNRVDTPRKRNRTNPELTDLSALNPVTTYSQTNDQASENLSSMPPLLAENNDRTSVGNGAARLSLDLQRDRSSALQPSNCNVMLRQRPGPLTQRSARICRIYRPESQALRKTVTWLKPQTLIQAGDRRRVAFKAFLILRRQGARLFPYRPTYGQTTCVHRGPLSFHRDMCYRSVRVVWRRLTNRLRLLIFRKYQIINKRLWVGWKKGT